MDDFMHHENIREKITNMLDEAIEHGGTNLDPRIHHLLVNICKAMYDKGVQDGHRICKRVIEVSMDVYKE